MLAPKLLEYRAEQRELIFDDFKRELRKFDHMGHGPLDIALWDWAGKKLNCSISLLLGSYRLMQVRIMGIEMEALIQKKLFHLLLTSVTT